MQEISERKDRLARNERRGIWLALVIVLALASTLLMGGEARQTVLRMLPVGLVLVIAGLVQQRTRATRLALRHDRQALARDEWRQMGMGRASRWTLALLLGTLAVFCLLSTLFGFNISGQVVAVLAVALGATVFLALFLLFDRD